MAETFSKWLESIPSKDIDDLTAYVTANSGDWAAVDTIAEAQALVAKDPNLTDAKRAELNAQLGRAFVARHEGRGHRNWTLLAFGPGIFLMMLLVLSIIALGLFLDAEPNLLDRLSKLETARGLITFIFALGVMSLALIIVSASFISTTPHQASFDRAKEVFTSLVAILGTILGFYFGAGQTDTSTAAESGSASDVAQVQSD